MECFCSFRNIQDNLADGNSLYERIFGTPFGGAIKAFLGGIHVYPISTNDKSRFHQFGTMILLGIFIGYALNSGGGWTGDLIVADWHETEIKVS